MKALPPDVFETIWMSDHLVPGAPWAPAEWDTLECMTAWIHFASLYPHFRYGQIVLGNSYRPPALLAKMVSTLQGLTGSRAILGIGAGWMESEYRMYGYPYPAPKVRIGQMEDAIQLIRRLWTDSPATFTGQHFSIDAAYAEPRPAELPLIMIGASGEQLSLRAVARHADWWNTTTPTPADLRAKYKILAEHCRKIDRDPEEILINYQFQCVAIGDTEADARRIAEASPMYPSSAKSAIIGTSDQVAEKIRGYIDVGVRDINLRFADFPRTEGMLRFSSEVAPKLRNA